MNTLLEIFRDSFVLKIAVGIVTYLSSSIMTVDNNVTYNPEFTKLVNVELQEKFIEMNDLYFNDNNQKTLE